MEVDNCVDFYDLMITNIIQEKFNNSFMNPKFQYGPSQYAFSAAKENWGDKIFPLYNIFRNDPPQATSDYTSYANQFYEYRINDNEFINHLLLDFVFDIDFFSDNMFDMNKSLIDYYKFKSNVGLKINLNDIGISTDYEFEARLDPPEANHNIDQMLESGLFFRYTYKMTCKLLILTKIQPIKITKINFSLVDYHKYPEYYKKTIIGGNNES